MPAENWNGEREATEHQEKLGTSVEVDPKLREQLSECAAADELLAAACAWAREHDGTVTLENNETYTPEALTLAFIEVKNKYIKLHCALAENEDDGQTLRDALAIETPFTGTYFGERLAILLHNESKHRNETREKQ